MSFYRWNYRRHQPLITSMDVKEILKFKKNISQKAQAGN